MGNQQKKMEKKVIIFYHPNFQQVVLIDNNLMRVEISIQQQSIFYEWETAIKQLGKHNTHQFLLFPKSYEYSNKSLCGSSGILSIYYEAYPYLFKDQISNRMTMKRYFEQEQLWYLLYSLTNVAEFFSIFDEKVGDIQPNNIFLSEMGQLKIANRLSWPDENKNYQKTLLEQQITFLSPQQMKLIEKKIITNTENQIIAESFSIGLTVLQAALLYDFEQLYNPKQCTFNEQLLLQKLNELHEIRIYDEQTSTIKSYSNELKKIIIGLCEIKPKKRTVSCHIYDMLKPFQKQIINLLQFNKQQLSFNRKAINNQTNSNINKKDNQLQTITKMQNDNNVLHSSPLRFNEVVNKNNDGLWTNKNNNYTKLNNIQLQQSGNQNMSRQTKRDIKKFIAPSPNYSLSNSLANQLSNQQQQQQQQQQRKSILKNNPISNFNNTVPLKNSYQNMKLIKNYSNYPLSNNLNFNNTMNFYHQKIDPQRKNQICKDKNVVVNNFKHQIQIIPAPHQHFEGLLSPQQINNEWNQSKNNSQDLMNIISTRIQKAKQQFPQK